MKEHQIMLNATEDVKEFVNAASKCDFDIDISYNRIINFLLLDSKNRPCANRNGLRYTRRCTTCLQIYCIIFETALQSEHIFDGCYFCTHF